MAVELKNRPIMNIVTREMRRLGTRYFRGDLLDIGCGTKPYREMFAGCVDRHVGVDAHTTMHDTSAGELPRELNR